MDDVFLKHIIDSGRGGRLLLSGDLTEITVARLVEKLDGVGARPKVVDVGEVRFADVGAMVALARWVRRTGQSSLQLCNAPPQLGALLARYRLDTLLHVEAPSRRSIAA